MLRYLLLILTLVPLACVVFGIRYKRRNFGFILMSAIIAGFDIISFFLMGASGPKPAGKILVPYYMLHAWLLFAALLMVILIDRYKNFTVPLIVSAIACIYQTYLAISQLFGARVFSFQKRIYFRKAWFVAVDTRNTGLLFSFRSYRIITYLNMFIILAVLIWCILYAHKMFRARFVALFILLLSYCILEGLTYTLSLPVWMSSIIYNIIAVVCLYFTGPFAENRLREWSLDSFANDMNDGLILYDEFDDLIHMNDKIRNTLNEDLLEEFKDIERLWSWISVKNEDDEEGVVTYEGEEQTFYFRVTVKDLEERGLHLGTLVILHDATDDMIRIRTVEKANEELELASRMKSDFLANMSHEIRTPMNAVIGMAQIALREQEPSMITDYLLQIQSSGKNLLNIINDILDYSKIESGKMEIIEDEYEPLTELSDIAGVLGTRIGDKPLELFVLVNSVLPHKLSGDAMRIRQILINLANNAVKFTPEGKVRIEVTCEPVSEDTVNITYHVKDTGIGIKEEDLDKLFVSFQQVDSRRNRAVEGTGLGLAISQKLVEAMGGKIGVSSEYGVGSDFWFTIPQKVIDDTNDLIVENAADKHVFILCDDDKVIDIFNREMDRFGIDGSAIATTDLYVPSGKKDYLFFVEDKYSGAVWDLLKANPDLNGVILIGFFSEFVPDLENMHIMRRPESTMSLVRMLNDQYDEARSLDEEKVFTIDYIAPDARILVVDDNDINLTIAEGLLSPLKVQIDKANGGQEAIDMVKAKDYDIVFMDHMMPGIDGVDATKIIRSTEAIAKQPVIIALSANVMEEAKHLFNEAGMNDFVPKPVDIRDMVTALKKWLPADKIVESEGAEVTPAGGDQKIDLQLNGLDLEHAVMALGSIALYEKIAGEYYRSGEEKLSGIRKAFEDKDWPDYTIRVHALKSSSRQIGAMALGDMAEALEKAGKAGDIDTIMRDTDAALDEFAKLLGDLKPVYGKDEDTGVDKPLIDRETLDKLLDELAEACDNLDMDAMEVVGNRLKEYDYDSSFSELVKELVKAIGNIDTDTCMEISAKLRA